MAVPKYLRRNPAKIADEIPSLAEGLVEQFSPLYDERKPTEQATKQPRNRGLGDAYPELWERMRGRFGDLMSAGVATEVNNSGPVPWMGVLSRMARGLRGKYENAREGARDERLEWEAEQRRLNPAREFMAREERWNEGQRDLHQALGKVQPLGRGSMRDFYYGEAGEEGVRPGEAATNRARRAQYFRDRRGTQDELAPRTTEAQSRRAARFRARDLLLDDRAWDAAHGGPRLITGPNDQTWGVDESGRLQQGAAPRRTPADKPETDVSEAGTEFYRDPDGNWKPTSGGNPLAGLLGGGGSAPANRSGNSSGGGIPKFTSEQEALNSNLPSGTVVEVNGRRFRIR